MAIDNTYDRLNSFLMYCLKSCNLKYFEILKSWATKCVYFPDSGSFRFTRLPPPHWGAISSTFNSQVRLPPSAELKGRKGQKYKSLNIKKATALRSQKFSSPRDFFDPFNVYSNINIKLYLETMQLL